MFDAAEDEDFGLRVLHDLSEHRDQRQRGDLDVKQLPDATRWLSRELSYSDDGAQYAVELNMWIRSTEGLSEACSSAVAIIGSLAKEPASRDTCGARDAGRATGPCMTADLDAMQRAGPRLCTCLTMA